MTNSPDKKPTPAASKCSASIRVLVVDDDEAFRSVLSRRLLREGFDCITAPTADEAVSRLEADSIDVVLADIHMPGNQDLELVRRINRSDHSAPVVLLTGNPTVETATQSVGLRVAAYMVKPPETSELIELLKKVSGEHRNGRLIQEHRERLQDWDQELVRLQRLLKEPSPSTQKSAMKSYLRLTLRNLIVGLVDLENFLTEEEEEGADGNALARQELTKAVQKTITVLEETRGQFKSKALGELRKELQQLVE